MPGARRALAMSLFGCGLALAGCAEVGIDWTRTGQLWLGALCDSAPSCTYDADGDPMTRW